jgi:glycosyltransferase involved in cell wall biosynthesis
MDLLGLAHRPSSVAAELAAAGIGLEHEAAPLGVLWQQLLLPRRLARGDVDLLWSPLMTLPLSCPVPAVVTVHDLTTLLMPESHRFKVKWSVYPFLRPSLERARRVVAVSEASAADLRFHFPECAGRLRVIHPGIDPEFRPGAADEIEATRRELGAPEGYLLYAGTLEPRKNVHTLLAAWEGLRRDAPETPPLVLAGPYGWGGKALLRRIEELRPLGLVHLGHVDRARLVRLFQAASVFLYPSLYEGFGLPVAEALACGVPAVVSRTSSLPEVVGDAGLTVEPLDPGAIAGAVRDLLANPARAAELGQRGIERARSFRWERAAAEMEETFAEALE